MSLRQNLKSPMKPSGLSAYYWYWLLIIVRVPTYQIFVNPDISTGWNFIAEMYYIDLQEHFQECCRITSVEQFFLLREMQKGLQTTFGRHQKCEKFLWLSFVGTFLEGNYLEIPKILSKLISVYIDQKLWSKICIFLSKKCVFLDIFLQSPFFDTFFSNLENVL